MSDPRMWNELEDVWVWYAIVALSLLQALAFVLVVVR